MMNGTVKERFRALSGQVRFEIDKECGLLESDMIYERNFCFKFHQILSEFLEST